MTYVDDLTRVIFEIRDLLRDINERGKRQEKFSREQAAKLDAELEEGR